MNIRGLLRRLYFRAANFLLAPYLFQSRNALFRKPVNDFFWHAFRALEMNQIDGDYVEFGVFKGRTWRTAFAAAAGMGYHCHFWAFDSFEGLPPKDPGTEEHDRWQPGALKNSRHNFEALCAQIGMRLDQYTIVPGFFEDSLVRIPPEGPPRNISLAYLDCDMYKSTREVLSFLVPRLKHGMIIAFDDYFIWSHDQLSGNRQAYLELLANHEKWHLEPFASINWHGKAFVVEDRSLLG